MFDKNYNRFVSRFNQRPRLWKALVNLGCGADAQWVNDKKENQNPQQPTERAAPVRDRHWFGLLFNSCLLSLSHGEILS